MNTKKKKRMVSITVTLILTTLFSIGAFAWFTISNQANVNNLALSAGTIGSLKVAADVDGNTPADSAFNSVLDLGMAGSLVLNPVTSSDGVTFNAPVYTGNVVTGLTPVTNETKDAYVFETKFWLKVDEADGVAASKYNIYLTASNSKAGTYLESKAAGPTDDTVNAIRISFSATDLIGNQVKVYEPGNGAANTEKVTAQDSSIAETIAPSLIQNKGNGNFSGGTNNNSPTIFQVNSEQAILVTMRVWIEGKDPDCANSIQLDTITGNIQFAADKVMTNN